MHCQCSDGWILNYTDGWTLAYNYVCNQDFYVNLLYIYVYYV